MIGRRAFIGGAGAAVAGAVLLGPCKAQPASSSVSPADFGAAGDGRTNDGAALIRCFTHAAERRLSVDGAGRTFACSESLWFEGLPFVSIKSLSLQQTNLQNDRCCLGFAGTNAILVDRLRIHTGSAAAIGDMGSTRGFHVRGGRGHRISNVEVTGNGKASFIRLEECADGVFTNLHVHDCLFDDPEAPDDVVQGIHVYKTSNSRLVAPRVANLTGNARYFDRSRRRRTFANLRTRGIAVAGNQNLLIENPEVSNTDQAIDVTGSDGNRRVIIRGGHSRDCGSVGVKFANSAVECSVTGHKVTRSGMWGFLASGPSEANLPFKTRDCAFVDCEANDVGYNHIHNDLDSIGEDVTVSSGFAVVRGDFDRAHPFGIRFVNCTAADRGGTMMYGFLNEAGPGGGTPNSLENCRSFGHAAAFERGFGAGR